MKKIALIVFAVLSCPHANSQSKRMNNPSINGLKADHQKENALAAKIFKALQEKNVNQWILLYPTDAEFTNVVQLMYDPKADEPTQRNINEMIMRRRAESSSVFKGEFKNLMRQADSLGIAWKDASIQKFDHDAAYLKKINGKYLNGDTWFICGHRHFVIEGIEALQIKSEYRLQAVKGIRQVDDGE